MFVCITNKVLDDIISTIGSKEPETGGIIGCDAFGTICAYYYDSLGTTESHCYVPNETSLNRVISEVWYPKNISYCGFIHSHHPMYPKLSEADYRYAGCIIDENIHMSSIFMGIVIPNSSIENVQFNLESISRDGTRKSVTLSII